LGAETGRRAEPEFALAPLRYLASAEDAPVYVASVGGGDRSLYQGN
jgi:hypothetical protein